LLGNNSINLSTLNLSESNAAKSINEIKDVKDVIDLEEFERLCHKNINNPKIGYLNINHIRNKIIDLECMIKDTDFAYLAIAETKIDDSFPNTQFNINGYLNPKEFRRDRNGNGGGMLIYIKKGIPCKRLKKFECQEIETIAIELRIGSQKWCIISVYRSEQITVDSFLSNFSKTLDNVFDEYENVAIIGDLNINTLKNLKAHEKSKYEKLKNFCDTYDLSNLIKSPTCFQSEEPSSIDVILTNKKRSFMHSKSIQNGLSDHHSIICSMLKTTIKKIKPTQIKYRCMKHFDEGRFFTELENKIGKINFNRPKNDFSKFAGKFLDIVDKHAPIKTKIIRGNDAPFMNANLRNEIRHRSKFCNRAHKLKTAEARLAFRKQRNKCTRLVRESQKAYFENVNNRNGKQFWKTI